MSNTQKIILAIIIIIVIVAVASFMYYRTPEPVPSSSPYSTPVATDMIRVTSPLPGATVTSPLTVTGEARGNWYFEASFPVTLLDANGAVLVRTSAQAQGDWMTNDFVPFTVTLTFTQPTTSTGTLILQNDNPSGDPVFDKEVRIPVKF